MLVLAVSVSACSHFKTKSDQEGVSNPSAEGESTPPMVDVDGRPRHAPTPQPSVANSPSPYDAFKSTGKEIFDTDRIHFNLNADEWTLIADEDGIQTYEKTKEDEGMVVFRGETVIPAYLPKIATILNDLSRRKEWIDSLVETRVIEQKNIFDREEYNHTKVPWPFEDRDFVYHARVRVNRTPPTMLITMQSVVDPREPEHDGLVRGRLIYSYYYLKQIEGVRATKVVVEMAVDPAGAIPKWLVRLSQKKWPFNTLGSLKKVAEREDIVVSKEIGDYFKVKKIQKKAQKIKPRRKIKKRGRKK